jgi:hypothetical protein
MSSAFPVANEREDSPYTLAVCVLYGDVLRNKTAAAYLALSGHSGEEWMNSAS